MDETYPPLPRDPTERTPQFSGDGRFQILRLLGVGGMGVVYEVFDRERNCRAALKTLRKMSPTALSRFKQEFRSLEQIAHPGLAQLYELISDGADWFFTMELVEGGVDLMTYLTDPDGTPCKPPNREDSEAGRLTAPWRQPESRSSFRRETFTAAHPDQLGTVDPDANTTLARPEQSRVGATGRRAATDYDRLRRTIVLLAEAVSALHAHGKLHRDIKPSNALVTPEGRLVLLDFGLVAEVQRTGLPGGSAAGYALSVDGGLWQQVTNQLGQIVGTLYYMSPEQAGGEALGEASDWYAVGVILYRALTGQLPHGGSGLSVVQAKRTTPPEDPGLLAPKAPADLIALCRDLLKIKPADRPTGPEILSWLGQSPAPHLAGSPAAPFVGRTVHLAALHKAFSSTDTGAAVVVAVHGRSGAGKTTLVAKFLDQVAVDPSVVILAGRCHEQEAVPYKAIDSLIDALTTRLLKQAAAGDPEDVLALPFLARIFPVLLRVPGVAALPGGGEGDDPQVIRAHAIRALRLLVSRIADRGRLILYIDDLQWGDADSASLLASVLEAPTNPRMMLVVAYRDEYRESSKCIALLRKSVFGPAALGLRAEIEVGDLDAEAGQALATELLGPTTVDREALAERIAREAGGNPLFISELVQRVLDAPGPGGAGFPAVGPTTLDEVLWERVCRLPDHARRLLETLAAAGRPITLRIAQAAADRPADHRLLAELRNGRLLRTSGPRLDDEAATYHDRVRESILSRLSPAVLREHHARLAAVLEAAGTPEPDVLAQHHHQAGNLERALGWYIAAADQAALALAFDRAAGLYRTALEVAVRLGVDPPGLHERLADVLGNLGRGPEAAAEYLGAAAAARADTALRLKGKAAFQFCISGHVDEGRAAFRKVLQAVGFSMPAWPMFAAVSVLAMRLWLRARGLHLTNRADRPPSKAEIDRIDILRSVSVGVSVVDPMVGAYFQTHGTLLALQAGDPYRAALALAWEAAHHSLVGLPGKGVTERLLAAAAHTAGQAGQPHAAAMVDLARGIAFFMEGRFRDAWLHCDAAEALLGRCIDVPWERDTSKLFAIWGLLYLGDYAAAREKCTALYRECEARGDRYMLTNLGTQVTTLLSLAAGRPAEAARNLAGVMANWTRVGFNVQHHGGVLARAYIALYDQDGLAAWREMRSHALAYHTSLLIQCQQIRVDRAAMEARAALAAYRQTGERGWLRAADRRARRLEREGLPWAVGMAALARAAIARARGDPAAAVDHLQRAATQFEPCPATHLKVVARRRLGLLLGPVSGRDDATAADEWFALHAVADPERFAGMWAPGLGSEQPSNQ